MTHAPCTTPDLTCDPSSGDRLKILPSGLNLVLLPPRLLAASLQGAADVVRKTFDGSYGDLCPACHCRHDKHQPCCGIPETRCPSACVGRIHWTGCPGDSFQYQVQVTNTADVEREFTLTAMPFPCTKETVKVFPDKKTLAPGESLTAVISFTVPETFAGSTYSARITVAGAYDQFIQVWLVVRPKQACCCHIEQGEIPKRIKAHHWFNHFQCEEDCFKPSKQAG
ncbi:hypothetical protein [Marinobacter caseinilyticus]|uniref:COG1470 family protein n=1 Tax=Marinobacter caseinilyticus TaxID=2692195 RepID=UPI00140BBB01|nr:hypothetical protein [Marinobacter caseinilyticus]